jgi:hypothetical protein
MSEDYRINNGEGLFINKLLNSLFLQFPIILYFCWPLIGPDITQIDVKH